MEINVDTILEDVREVGPGVGIPMLMVYLVREGGNEVYQSTEDFIKDLIPLVPNGWVCFRDKNYAISKDIICCEW